MKRINRAVSAVLLFCFVLNTAVSDLAFGQSVYSNRNVNNLAPASIFSNLRNSQPREMAIIKIALEEQLKYLVGKDVSSVTSEELGGTIERNERYGRSQPCASGLKFFFKNMAILPTGKHCVVMCKFSQGDGKPRTYYAAFALFNNAEKMFPIEVYTEHEYKNKIKVTDVEKFAASFPRREKINPISAAKIEKAASDLRSSMLHMPEAGEGSSPAGLRTSTSGMGGGSVPSGMVLKGVVLASYDMLDGTKIKIRCDKASSSPGYNALIESADDIIVYKDTGDGNLVKLTEVPEVCQRVIDKILKAIPLHSNVNVFTDSFRCVSIATPSGINVRIDASVPGQITVKVNDEKGEVFSEVAATPAEVGAESQPTYSVNALADSIKLHIPKEEKEKLARRFIAVAQEYENIDDASLTEIIRAYFRDAGKKFVVNRNIITSGLFAAASIVVAVSCFLYAPEPTLINGFGMALLTSGILATGVIGYFSIGREDAVTSAINSDGFPDAIRQRLESAGYERKQAQPVSTILPAQAGKGGAEQTRSSASGIAENPISDFSRVPLPGRFSDKKTMLVFGIGDAIKAFYNEKDKWPLRKYAKMYGVNLVYVDILDKKEAKARRTELKLPRGKYIKVNRSDNGPLDSVVAKQIRDGLGGVKIDGVLNLTPPFLHLAVIKWAMDEKSLDQNYLPYVFTEKPAGKTRKDCEEILKLQRTHPKLVFMNDFDLDKYILLRGLNCLTDENFGTPVSVRAKLVLDEREERARYTDPDKFGGLGNDLVPHSAAQVEMFLRMFRKSLNGIKVNRLLSKVARHFGALGKAETFAHFVGEVDGIDIDFEAGKGLDRPDISVVFEGTNGTLTVDHIAGTYELRDKGGNVVIPTTTCPQETTIEPSIRKMLALLRDKNAITKKESDLRAKITVASADMVLRFSGEMTPKGSQGYEYYVFGTDPKRGLPRGMTETSMAAKLLADYLKRPFDPEAMGWADRIIDDILHNKPEIVVELLKRSANKDVALAIIEYMSGMTDDNLMSLKDNIHDYLKFAMGVRGSSGFPDTPENPDIKEQASVVSNRYASVSIRGGYSAPALPNTVERIKQKGFQDLGGFTIFGQDQHAIEAMKREGILNTSVNGPRSTILLRTYPDISRYFYVEEGSIIILYSKSRNEPLKAYLVKAGDRVSVGPGFHAVVNVSPEVKFYTCYMNSNNAVVAEPSTMLWSLCATYNVPREIIEEEITQLLKTIAKCGLKSDEGQAAWAELESALGAQKAAMLLKEYLEGPKSGSFTEFETLLLQYAQHVIDSTGTKSGRYSTGGNAQQTPPVTNTIAASDAVNLISQLHAARQAYYFWDKPDAILAPIELMRVDAEGIRFIFNEGTHEKPILSKPSKIERVSSSFSSIAKYLSEEEGRTIVITSDAFLHQVSNLQLALFNLQSMFQFLSAKSPQEPAAFTNPALEGLVFRASDASGKTILFQTIGEAETEGVPIKMADIDIRKPALDNSKAEPKGRALTGGRLAEVLANPAVNQPIYIGTGEDAIKVPNRVVAQPIEHNDGNNGHVTELTLASYARLAKMGLGVIWIESVTVADARARKDQLMIGPGYEDDIRKIVECIWANSPYGKDQIIVIQPNSSGSLTDPRFSEPTRTYQPREKPDDAPGRLLANSDVEKIIQSYVDAAVIAYNAGVNMVDIKCCHGYQLSQFLRLANQERENWDYGGSLDNRMKIVEEIMRRIRQEVPDKKFKIAVRFSMYEGIKGGIGSKGLDTEEMDLREPIEMCKRFVAAGAEMINVSAGVPNWTLDLTESRVPKDVTGRDTLKKYHHIDFAATVKEALRGSGKEHIVVVGSGFSAFKEKAAEVAGWAIEDGYVDMVGLGKQTVAGKDPCGLCMGCLDLLIAQGPVGCAAYIPFYRLLHNTKATFKSAVNNGSFGDRLNRAEAELADAYKELIEGLVLEKVSYIPENAHLFLLRQILLGYLEAADEAVNKALFAEGGVRKSGAIRANLISDLEKIVNTGLLFEGIKERSDEHIGLNLMASYIAKLAAKCRETSMSGGESKEIRDQLKYLSKVINVFKVWAENPQFAPSMVDTVADAPDLSGIKLKDNANTLQPPIPSAQSIAAGTVSEFETKGVFHADNAGTTHVSGRGAAQQVASLDIFKYFERCKTLPQDAVIYPIVIGQSDRYIVCVYRELLSSGEDSGKGYIVIYDKDTKKAVENFEQPVVCYLGKDTLPEFDYYPDVDIIEVRYHSATLGYKALLAYDARNGKAVIKSTEAFLGSIPVCGLVSPGEGAEAVVDSIIAAGNPHFGVEVSLVGNDRDAALNIIRYAAEKAKYTNIVITAEVLNKEGALAAIKAGAGLIVTPGLTLSKEDIADIHNLGAKVVLGVGSVEEAKDAMTRGADAMQVPFVESGLLGLIRNISPIPPETPLLVAGGVTMATIPDLFEEKVGFAIPVKDAASARDIAWAHRVSMRTLKLASELLSILETPLDPDAISRLGARIDNILETNHTIAIELLSAGSPKNVAEAIIDRMAAPEVAKSCLSSIDSYLDIAMKNPDIREKAGSVLEMVYTIKPVERTSASGTVALGAEFEYDRLREALSKDDKGRFTAEEITRVFGSYEYFIMALQNPRGFILTGGHSENQNIRGNYLFVTEDFLRRIMVGDENLSGISKATYPEICSRITGLRHEIMKEAAKETEYLTSVIQDAIRRTDFSYPVWIYGRSATYGLGTNTNINIALPMSPKEGLQDKRVLGFINFAMETLGRERREWNGHIRFVESAIRLSDLSIMFSKDSDLYAYHITSGGITKFLRNDNVGIIRGQISIDYTGASGNLRTSSSGMELKVKGDIGREDGSWLMQQGYSIKVESMPVNAGWRTEKKTELRVVIRRGSRIICDRPYTESDTEFIRLGSDHRFMLVYSFDARQRIIYNMQVFGLNDTSAVSKPVVNETEMVYDKCYLSPDGRYLVALSNHHLQVFDLAIPWPANANVQEVKREVLFKSAKEGNKTSSESVWETEFKADRLVVTETYITDNKNVSEITEYRLPTFAQISVKQAPRASSSGSTPTSSATDYPYPQGKIAEIIASCLRPQQKMLLNYTDPNRDIYIRKIVSEVKYRLGEYLKQTITIYSYNGKVLPSPEELRMVGNVKGEEIGYLDMDVRYTAIDILRRFIETGNTEIVLKLQKYLTTDEVNNLLEQMLTQSVGADFFTSAELQHMLRDMLETIIPPLGPVPAARGVAVAKTAGTKTGERVGKRTIKLEGAEINGSPLFTIPISYSQNQEVVGIRIYSKDYGVCMLGPGKLKACLVREDGSVVMELPDLPEFCKDAIECVAEAIGVWATDKGVFVRQSPSEKGITIITIADLSYKRTATVIINSNDMGAIRVVVPANGKEILFRQGSHAQRYSYTTSPVEPASVWERVARTISKNNLFVVTVHDDFTGEDIAQVTYNGVVKGINVSKDKDHLIIVGNNSKGFWDVNITVYDLRTAEIVPGLENIPCSSATGAVQDNGKYLVVCRPDGKTIDVYDFAGKKMEKLSGLETYVMSGFKAEESYLAVCDIGVEHDYKLTCYDWVTGEPLKGLSGLDARVGFVTMDKHIAVVDSEKHLTIYEVSSGKKVQKPGDKANDIENVWVAAKNLLNPVAQYTSTGFAFTVIERPAPVEQKEATTERTSSSGVTGKDREIGSMLQPLNTGIVPSLQDILKLLPHEWLDGLLDTKEVRKVLRRAGYAKGIRMLYDGKSAFVFSEKATFGEYNEKEDKYEEGLGIILPSIAKSGIRIAVVVSNDEKKALKQRTLIVELNKARELAGEENIICINEVAEVEQSMPAPRYYYFKVEGEPDAGVNRVTSIPIIVKKILEAIGRIKKVPADMIKQMHEAARQFAIAA